MTEPTEPLTMQRYFTETVEYLRTQKRAIMIDSEGDPTCSYQNPEGVCCAVGRWIPEDHIVRKDSINYSGDGVLAIADRFPELVGVAWPTTSKTRVKYGHAVNLGLVLAEELQSLHDAAQYRGLDETGLSEEGEFKAQEIAAEFNLEYTPATYTPATSA